MDKSRFTQQLPTEMPKRLQQRCKRWSQQGRMCGPRTMLEGSRYTGQLGTTETLRRQLQ